MPTIKCNASNWSGKILTVKYNDDLEFDLFGYSFKLVFNPWERQQNQTDEDWQDLLDLIGPGNWKIMGNAWKHPLGVVSYDPGTKSYLAADSPSDFGIRRENDGIVAAAVQLLANII